MIEVDVSGLALDAISAQPILLLNDKAKLRALPIWIGKAEARAIAFALEHVKSERPLTHDLLLQVIDQIGYQVTSVEINDLESSTYFATVFLTCREASEAVKCIDARPSDAIALAIASNAPIFVSPEVMELGSYPIKQEDEIEEKPVAEVKPEEFKEFVENLKPSDFSKFLEEKEKKKSTRRKKKAEPGEEQPESEKNPKESKEPKELKETGKETKETGKDSLAKETGKETSAKDKGSARDKEKGTSRDKDKDKDKDTGKGKSEDKPKNKPSDSD